MGVASEPSAVTTAAPARPRDRRRPRSTCSRAPQSELGARGCLLREQAVSLWPRLDRRALARDGCDPLAVARTVARRTSEPLESIVAMLAGDA